jgi:uncharacterized membrane protein
MARSFVYYGDSYIHEMFGVLGWNYVVLPVAFILATVLLMVITALYAKDEFIKLKRESFIIAGSCVVGAATIFAILYVGFTPLAKNMVDGVQGRYFLPFLLPLIVCIVNLLPVKITFNKSSSVMVMLGGASGTILALSALYYILLTY